MTKIINTDPAVQVEIKARIGALFQLVITLLDDDGAPLDVTGYTFAFEIWDFNTNNKLIKTYAPDVTDNVLTITDPDFALSRPQAFHILWVTPPGGSRRAWINGNFIATSGLSKASVNNATLTVRDGDNVISLSVSNAGQSASGAGKLNISTFDFNSYTIVGSNVSVDFDGEVQRIGNIALDGNATLVLTNADIWRIFAGKITVTGGPRTITFPIGTVSTSTTDYDKVTRQMVLDAGVYEFSLLNLSENISLLINQLDI